MEIKELRNQIDAIDDELVRLFVKRMNISAQVAEYKKEHKLPIHVPAREQEILQEVAKKAGSNMANYSRVLYSMIFELSRSYQSKRSLASTELYQMIANAIENTPKLFPQVPMVACLGVEGACSQIACKKMFQLPLITYFKNIDSIFHAIDQGLCQYGVVPIENSTTGSVKEVYDLMVHHNFSIVRTIRMNVDHNLIAKPNTKIEDIKEIYSHEQAIKQCSEFLKSLNGVKIIPVENTATASGMVAQSGRTDIAAISSNFYEERYGLTCLADSIQDTGNNRTCFICISKNLEIYPGSDKTSIMMILPNKPDALYKVLARLYVLGINVTKLESSPISDKNFSFMFYFDLETSIYSEEFMQLMCELDELSEEFKYLGSYTEVV